jgi:hypothetical protein
MKNTNSRLAPIETASFYGGVHHKRYSVERDKWSLKIKNSCSLKKIKLKKSLLLKAFSDF